MHSLYIYITYRTKLQTKERKNIICVNVKYDAVIRRKQTELNTQKRCKQKKVISIKWNDLRVG